MDFSREKIFTVANFFSLLRILLVPVIGWLLFLDNAMADVWAGALLLLAVGTDFLDGLAARMLDQVSDLGRIIDPLADKLFIIFIGTAFIWLRDFPIWLAALIVAKDLAIVGAGVVIGRRQDVVMESNWFGKYAFAFQAVLVISYFLRFPYGIWSNTIGTIVFIFLTMWSYGRAGIRIIRNKDPKPPLSRHTEFLITQFRRWGTVLLAIIFFVHLFYWALENNRVGQAILDLPPIEAEQAMELAEEFAPIMKFSTNGRVPMPAESFPGNGIMKQGERHFLGALDGEVLRFPLAEGSIPIEHSYDTYIIPGSPLEDLVSRPPVYFRVVAVDDDLDQIALVIQYWMLFAREDVPYPRVGDWQMASVYLSADMEPLYMAANQGWYGVAKEWGNVELAQGRPVLYVGQGSNAIAFSGGDHVQFLDQEFIFGWYSDVFGGEEKLFPQEDYSLIRLNGNEPWLLWQGRWGGPFPGGDRGPRYWNPKNPKLSPWSAPLQFLRFYF